MGTPATIPLGPFDLVAPIGKGGMAVVWRGVHREHQLPVAVKVVQPDAQGDRAIEEERQRSFHREIRAVSALDHPGIVRIFDHGEIPDATAAASEGRLRVGAPYLVMELASGGTLRTFGRASRERSTTLDSTTGGTSEPGREPTGPAEGPPAPLSYPTLRAILLTLLDALAHAHARGVLHRDLKPDNVLLCGPRDQRPGIKLSDFGIARPLDDSFELEDKPVGTPQYMAPEQLKNDRDAFGPHTDLYALGHLAWRLAAGRMAFQGLAGPSLLYAQMRKPPPPFSPLFPVPPGFETFVRTLLQKEPHARYQRAADAALALSGLTADDLDDGEPLADTRTLRVVIGGRRASGSLTPDLRPPLPEQFTEAATAPPPALLGAGLGLFGLRTVPFVGREAELQRAWRELGRVHTEGRTHLLVVRGPEGVGKTRFLERIAERAHELGAANVLTAARLGGGTAVERLAEPLVRFLHAHPQDPATLERRYGDWMRGVALESVRIADAVGILLDPTELELPEVQRHSILRRTLEVMAQDRPLVLCFDDVEESPDVLKLARQLLATQDRAPAPILVLVSVTSDAVGTELARHLSSLETHPATSTIELLPFEATPFRSLVAAVAPLDPALNRRVASATAGNALHAVQCISDWVARDALTPGKAGYVRRATELPESLALEEVWDRRMRTVTTGIEGPVMAMLERAAVAGLAVDVFEWQAASDDPDGRYAAQNRALFQPGRARMRTLLVEALVESGLAKATETGFVFTHRGFHRALLERARSAGRYRAHAGAYAATLEHRCTDATAGRCANYHVEAGAPDRAVPLLFRAEAWERRSLGPAAALATLGRTEVLLRRARVARDDPRWVEARTARSELLAATSAFGEAGKVAAEAQRLAAAAALGHLEARARRVLGSVAQAAGRLDVAEAQWNQAVALLGRDGPVVESVRTWHMLRRLAVNRGDRDEAARRGEQIRRLAGRATEPQDRIQALLALAEHLSDAEEPEAAASSATEALTLADRKRDGQSAAKAWSLLAGLAEDRTDWVGARDAWMHAVELLEDHGDERRAGLARCRWALVECHQGRWTSAESIVDPARPAAERSPDLAAGLHGVLAVAAAGRGNWTQHDREFATLGTFLGAVPAHAHALVDLALFAAGRCRDAGHAARERAWLLLARDRVTTTRHRGSAAELLGRLEILGS